MVDESAKKFRNHLSWMDIRPSGFYSNQHSTANPRVQNLMASSIVSRNGRTLSRAVPKTPSAALAIPGFLVPAWQDSASPRQFSTTTKCPSKLGRTPLSVPPGVEILVSDPITKKKATSWKPTVHKAITVKGPLGKEDSCDLGSWTWRDWSADFVLCE